MMKQIQIYILLIGVITLLFPSCIKNDVPYPRIKAQILEIEAEGQVGNAVIDNANQTVTFVLADNIDPRHVHIKKLVTTEGATYNFPADSIIDLSDDYELTLSIYQDYTWTISASLDINYTFEFNDQRMSVEWDTHNHRAVAYIDEDADLYDVHINSLILGPRDITTYTPDPKDITDFSLGFQKVIINYYDIMEEWTLYIVPTDISVQVDAWTNVAWLYGSGSENTVNGFEYKRADEENWTTVPTEKIDHDGGNFSTRLVGLKANTTYLCRSTSDGAPGSETSFTTGLAEPLPNGSFDDWFLEGKIWNPWIQGEPNFWDTGNKGATTLGDSNTQPTDDTESGTGRAAQLSSKFVGFGTLGKLAAGNIYVGNYISTDGTNGILNFGKPFTQRPTYLTGYYKYLPVPINKTTNGSEYSYLIGRPDTCQIYIALGDWDAPVEIRTNPNNRKVFDINDPHIIAYAGLSSGDPIEEYTFFSLELKYRDYSRVPKYIVVVASASKYGDYFTGGDGSVLYIDNFSLEYDYDN